MEKTMENKFLSYNGLIAYNTEIQKQLASLSEEVTLLRKEFEEYKNQNSGKYIVKDEGYYYPFGEY